MVSGFLFHTRRQCCFHIRKFLWISFDTILNSIVLLAAPSVTLKGKFVLKGLFHMQYNLCMVYKALKCRE